MKRVVSGFIGVAIAVFALSLIGSIGTTGAQETSSPSIWSDNVIVSDEGAITATQAARDPLCQVGDIRIRTTAGPLDSLIGGGQKHSPGNESQSEPVTSCVIRTKQGLFAGNRYFSPSKDPSKVMRINQTRYGSNFMPAPNGRAVLVNTYNPARRAHIMSINYNMLHGNLAYTRTTFNQYDIDWAPEFSNPGIKYTNGQHVLNYGQAFSRNGKYLLVRVDANTFGRINLQTQEFTPFYRQLSARGVVSMAISGDGRYAVTNISGDLRIHDIGACDNNYPKNQWQAATTTAVPDGCTSKNYRNQLRAATGNYDAGYYGGLVRGVSFSNNDSEITLAAGKSANDWKRVSLRSGDFTEDLGGYLALGDSFSSGEGDLGGDEWYEPGTDEQGDKSTFEGRNLCHVSRRSYPYLIAKQLGYLTGDAETPVTPADNGLFHSVACSGAVINNILGGSDNKLIKGPGSEEQFSVADNQYRNDFLATLGRWQPGRISQLDIFDTGVFGGYSSAETKPQVITVGIGGNDAGFGDTIKACAMPGTCKQAVEGSVDASNLAARLMKLKPELTETYSQVKDSNPGSHIYVVGYPVFVSDREGSLSDLISGGTCRFNVRLNYSERNLVIKGVKYMNQVIKSAADEAGVVYVDIEDILAGKNLCSGADRGEYAFNGITAGNDIDFKLCIFRTGCLGKESYHPNQAGQKLYAEAIADATDSLTTGMPQAIPTNTPMPDIFFGSSAQSQAAAINNGANYSVVIPEPKPFLSLSGTGQLEILQSGFMPGTNVAIEVHSTPQQLATITVPENGVIDANITFPGQIGAGQHEIHLIGTSTFGEQVDYYEPIAIGVSADDFDGDNIVNSLDSCQTIVNSGVDIDVDGVDDVCDGEITQTQQDDQSAGDDQTASGSESDDSTVNRTTSQVLGANTAVNETPSSSGVLGESDLAATGSSVVLAVIVGTSILVITFMTIKVRGRVNQD